MLVVVFIVVVSGCFFIIVWINGGLSLEISVNFFIWYFFLLVKDKGSRDGKFLFVFLSYCIVFVIIGG